MTALFSVQGMDRGIFGERRPGHAAEQVALDQREIDDRHHSSTAVRRMSTGRRQVQDRIALHIHSSGVFVVLGFGFVDFHITILYYIESYLLL